MKTVEGRDIYYSYEYAGSKKYALEDASFEMKKGELVAILGHNGCGKSTLVRHLNGLLELQKGELTVLGITADNEAEIWKLRRRVGMVFQNPDNQFVSSVVEEDVAFGLENYQVPREEIPQKITRALSAVRMTEYSKHSPHMLSGGQKQRVALAGVLALDPDILIFDEATSMLDPKGRGEILDMIKKLRSKGDKTIIMITHYVEECVFADRIYLMKDGKIMAAGTPEQILADEALLAETDLKPPLAVKAYHDLKKKGIELPFCPLTEDELVEGICRSKQKI